MPTWAIGGIAGLLALIGAFFFGRSTGIDHQKAIDLAAMGRAQKAVDRANSQINFVNAKAATAQNAQQQETRTIYGETIKIIERPVFRNICADPDGVQLLDRAAANANRGLAGEPDGIASRTAPVPAQR